MNIIEQLGGIEKAKEIIGAAEFTDIFYNIDRDCYMGLMQLGYGNRVSISELRNEIKNWSEK